jgi:hypothetical protein
VRAAGTRRGYLLARTERSTGPMEVALDMALARMRALTPGEGGAAERRRS